MCPLNLDGDPLMRVINFGGFMEGKISYSLYNKSQFSDDLSKVEITNNKDFNKFLYGLFRWVIIL
jgi:hypothetical protein